MFFERLTEDVYWIFVVNPILKVMLRPMRGRKSLDIVSWVMLSGVSFQDTVFFPEKLWLAEIGLNVKLEMLDTPTWIDGFLAKPVPQDRRAIFQSSHGNEAGDGIFTMNSYYHTNARQVTFPDATMDDLISAAIPLTGEARQQALAKAFAYQHDEIVQDCPMVHLQAVWGLSERVDWKPRFDNLILIKTASIIDKRIEH